MHPPMTTQLYNAIKSLKISGFQKNLNNHLVDIPANTGKSMLKHPSEVAIQPQLSNLKQNIYAFW